ASKTNARVGLSAAVGSVVLFAAALLAGLRFRRRLVVPLVEFDRAVRFQHFTIDALELRLGKGRCRFARTALVGVLRQRLAALEVEVIGRAIDRHPGADIVGEGGDEDWTGAHRIPPSPASGGGRAVRHSGKFRNERVLQLTTGRQRKSLTRLYSPTHHRTAGIAGRTRRRGGRSRPARNQWRRCPPKPTPIASDQAFCHCSATCTQNCIGLIAAPAKASALGQVPAGGGPGQAFCFPTLSPRALLPLCDFIF